MIGWSDVRWRFRRDRTPISGTAGTIALELLRAADEPLLAEVIAFHEALVGETREANDPAMLEALVGDYRLARGLSSVLAPTYSYRSLALAEAEPEVARRLLPHGVERPAGIRRRLWERANREGGFAVGPARERIIAEVAAELGCPPDALWQLAQLDADRAAVLERLGEPPTPAALRLAYNRAAVEAALVRAETVTLALPGLDGATGRHLLARCRRLGLVCELSAEPGAVGSLFPTTAGGPAAGRRVGALTEDPSPGPAGAATTGPAAVAGQAVSGPVEPSERAAQPAAPPPRALRLELFGRPEQVGPAGGYGHQLATTARWLLLTAAPRGHAVLLIGKRRYALPLDAQLLRAIGAEDAAREPAVGYDSAAEERLHREWRVAATRDRHAGWQLEREPELVVASNQVLFPDFRLRRGDLMVYVELIGFWSPAYLERKRRKLAAVARAGLPLLAAVEERVRDALGPLPLPTVAYRGELGWAELLAAVERSFDDPRGRAATAAAGLGTLLAEAAERALLPAPELMARLGLHGASELERSIDAAEPLPPGWRWLPGVGLVRQDYLSRLGEAVRARVEEAADELSFDAARSWLATETALDPGAAEALLDALESVTVDWSDLLAPTVRPRHA